jgi:hypothetical protein
MTLIQQVVDKLKDQSLDLWALASGEPKNNPTKFTTNLNRIDFALKPSQDEKILLQVREGSTGIFYSLKLNVKQQKTMNKVYADVVKHNVKKHEGALEETLKVAVQETKQMKLPI